MCSERPFQDASLPIVLRLLRGRSATPTFLASLLFVLTATPFTCLPISSSHGATITLADANSLATFHTEAADGGTLGLNEWVVNNTDHVSQQWFWYRVGEQQREHAIDGTGPLTHTSSNAIDIDGIAGDDLLLTIFEDAETVVTPETFVVEFVYLLRGGTVGSNRSDMSEVVRVINTGESQFNFHLFQFANFDVNATPNDDAVVITGTPANTARQTDPLMQVAETVATANPSHWEVGLASDLASKLNDDQATTLADIAGPLLNLDAGWAFQWDALIPQGDVLLVSKDKNLRPGPNIPEPGTLALLWTGAVGLLGYAWRRRRAG